MDKAVESQQSSRLGTLLIEKRWLTAEQLKLALKIQREQGSRLGETLVQLNMITNRQLNKILVRQRWSRSIFAGLMMATSPLLLTACGGENDEPKAEIQATAQANQTNIAPEVDAGEDITIYPEVSVTFNAAASDSDGTIETIQWQQVSGNSVDLINSSSVQATFNAPPLSDPQVAETFVFQITATDNDGATTSDTVNVTVTPAANINQPPTVSLGTDLTTEQNTMVTMSATANDSDGSIESYHWTQIDGEYVSLDDISSAQASFLTPALTNPEVAETFVFQVLVTDNEGATETDTISVTVTPEESNVGLASISWNPPTQNTDSSPIENLNGFIIYYGVSDDNLNETVTIDDANAYSHLFENLNPNTTYYFAVSAVNALGIESEKSNIVSKHIDG